MKNSPKSDNPLPRATITNKITTELEELLWMNNLIYRKY